MAKKKDLHKNNDLTPEEQAMFDAWKAQQLGKKLSQSDQAIIELATNAAINAICGKLSKGLLVLYSTYNRNYHFNEVGSIKFGSIELTEATKKARRIGEYDLKVSKNKCEFTFRLFGCEIDVTYNKDPNFMEI